MTEYVWTSPGGAYVVPLGFRNRFLNEFPTYRIRWSLRESKWLIEQQYGNPLPPTRPHDPFDDHTIRANDGYWLVMSFRPGTRMACPLCGLTIPVPMMKTAETSCMFCRAKGLDGRHLAGYWPFDERLIDCLRSTDPRHRGVMKDARGQLRVRASMEAERANDRRELVMQRATSDAVSSIDAVDYRWISGIPSAGATRRQLDSADFT